MVSAFTITLFGTYDSFSLSASGSLACYPTLNPLCYLKDPRTRYTADLVITTVAWTFTWLDECGFSWRTAGGKKRELRSNSPKGGTTVLQLDTETEEISDLDSELISARRLPELEERWYGLMNRVGTWSRSTH